MSGLRITAAGDFVANGLEAAVAAPLAALGPALESCDLFLFNQECPIVPADATSLTTGSSIVRGDASVFGRCFPLGVPTVASLANNHMTDFGPEGIRATQDVLAAADVVSVGGHPDKAQAREPRFVEAGGKRIAVLAYCSDRGCVGDHLKTELGEYLGIIDDRCPDEIRAVAARADATIIVCHWGREFIDVPIPEDRALARAMIDAGADVVLGHHAHVVQGWEEHGGKRIYYGLGNLFFPEQTEPQVLRWNDSERTGILADLHFTEHGIEHGIRPFALSKQDGWRLLEGEAATKVLDEVEACSRELRRPNADYERFFEAKLKRMHLRKTAEGIRRNLLRPRKKHFHMLKKAIVQMITGRRSFTD